MVEALQLRKSYAFIISFLIGLTLAITVMVLLLRKDSAFGAIFGVEYFNNLSMISVERMHFWRYVLFNRFKLLILWFLIGQVRNYELIYLIAVGGVGALLGVMLSSIVMNFGAGGILLFLAMLVPHCIFYYISAFLVVKSRAAGRIAIQKQLIVLVLIILSLLLGVTLESFFSPILVDKICKIV